MCPFNIEMMTTLITCLVVGVMTFTPPDRKERLEAIGRIDKLPVDQRRAFMPADHFHPIPAPGAHDWLANHPEEGQSFREYLASAPNIADKQRRNIILQPLCEFRAQAAPNTLELQEFAPVFFNLPVGLRPPIEIEDAGIQSRINPYTKNRQLFAPDILRLFHRTLLCYAPAFYGDSANKVRHGLLFRRVGKVLAHEVGHMVGISHCIYFHCLMNGSNHLEESDRRPV